MPTTVNISGSIPETLGRDAAATIAVRHDVSQSLSDAAKARARANIGVTSTTDVDTALAGKQPLDSDLTALAGLSSAGLVVRTGPGAVATRTITGTANEVSVANGDGVAGAPTLSLPNALTFTGKTITGGTFSGPTLSGTVAGTPTWASAQSFPTGTTIGGSVLATIGNLNDLRRESVVPSNPEGHLSVPAFTAEWAAAQFVASGIETDLVPHIPMGGAGDEGYHTITGDAVRNAFYTLDGLTIGNVVAYNASGTAVTVSSVASAPAAAEITLAATPALDARIHVWRRAGRYSVTKRAAGVKVTLNLRHGLMVATNQEILVRAYVNGTLVTSAQLAREESPAGEVSTVGTILLPAARGYGSTQDVVHLTITQTNASSAVIGIQAGSRIAVEPLSLMPSDSPTLVGGIHQGAPLTEAEIAALSEMDVFPVSGMWTGQIAQSGATAHGQEFFDGYVSSAWANLSDYLNRAQAMRSLKALPGRIQMLAYMTATVAAPDGTLAGQAQYTRFSSALGNLTANQTAFVAARDVSMQAFGGRYTTNTWIQIITAAGQFQLGYGALYDLVGGAYETVTTVGGLTATLRWSGAGLRDLTLTLSTPIASTDYVGIAQFVNRKDAPWIMTDAGRQNVRQMVAKTFSNSDFKSQIDGIFLDLCSPPFIDRGALEEVLKMLRPFAPVGGLMCNATIPAAEHIEHIASCPSFMSGDIIFMEGAGCKVGVDNEAATLRAVAERNRISAGGKHARLCWFATIPQDAAGPVQTDSRIITARNLFLANRAPGDIFMCHWSAIGTPHNGAPRPLPPRIDGITTWDAA